MSYQKYRVLNCVAPVEILRYVNYLIKYAKFHPVPHNREPYTFDMKFCTYFSIKCTLFHFCCNLFKVYPYIDPTTIKCTFFISIAIRQLTAENEDSITPNALFICLLFVCLLVYLFICLFVYIKAVNSCPEWTKVRGKTEKTVHRGSGMSFGRRPKFIQSVENGLNFAKI